MPFCRAEAVGTPLISVVMSLTGNPSLAASLTSKLGAMALNKWTSDTGLTMGGEETLEDDEAHLFPSLPLYQRGHEVLYATRSETIVPTRSVTTKHIVTVGPNYRVEIGGHGFMMECDKGVGLSNVGCHSRRGCYWELVQ